MFTRDDWDKKTSLLSLRYTVWGFLALGSLMDEIDLAYQEAKGEPGWTEIPSYSRFVEELNRIGRLCMSAGGETGTDIDGHPIVRM